jgi:RNA polymerase sigma-70 factor (ECF subfamily)
MHAEGTYEIFEANGEAGNGVLYVTPAEQNRNEVFLRLYVDNEEALRGFVRSLVPTLEDSREVMQEVAVVLWRKFEDISKAEDFRRWAFGVARLKALDFHRKRGRDRHCFGTELLELLASEAEQADTDYDLERQALEECLEKLPNPQRALVEAAYAPGVRMDALAKQSGRTAMSLYKTLHRIRITLIQCTQKTLSMESAR